VSAVRRIRPDDWRRLRDVRLRALADSPTAFATTHTEAAARPDEFWQDRALLGGRASTESMFVAEDGKRFAGLAGCYTDGDGVPQVISVWVEPQQRGSGLADALFDAVEGWARDAGLSRLTLWVNVANPRAIGFYERRDYRPTGRSQPFPNDPAMTEIEMTKPLR
jgi:GNAT superfamily N-acetyltransferase